MDGITVLNVIECGGIDPSCVLGTILFAILTLWLIIEVISDLFYGCFASGFSLMAFAILPIIMLIACATSINEPKYNKYQVTIDESVKMVEFNEKYEIIDQDGKIYTVIERED